MKRNLIFLLIGILIGGASYFIPREEKIKTVTKVQERVRVFTKIIERPDGTKETVIDRREDRQTDKLQSKSTVYSKWQLGLSRSLNIGSTEHYTLDIRRKVLGNISLGLYARTDRELGLSLSYLF